MKKYYDEKVIRECYGKRLYWYRWVEEPTITGNNKWRFGKSIGNGKIWAEPWEDFMEAIERRDKDSSKNSLPKI